MLLWGPTLGLYHIIAANMNLKALTISKYSTTASYRWEKNTWSTGQAISDAYRLIITSLIMSFLVCLPICKTESRLWFQKKPSSLSGLFWGRNCEPLSLSIPSIQPTMNSCVHVLCLEVKESRNSFTILSAHDSGRHHHRPSVLLDLVPTFIFLFF